MKLSLTRSDESAPGRHIHATSIHEFVESDDYMTMKDEPSLYIFTIRENEWESKSVVMTRSQLQELYHDMKLELGGEFD